MLSGVVDVTNIVQSAASLLQLMDELITGASTGGVGVAMLASFAIAGHALFRFYKMSQEGGANDPTGPGGVMAELVISGMLFSFGSTVSMVENSFGAGGVFGPMMVSASNPLTTAMVSAIHVGLISLGTISIFKGFLIMHKLSTGQQTQGDPFASALWHIAGGAACRAIAGFF